MKRFILGSVVWMYASVVSATPLSLQALLNRFHSFTAEFTQSMQVSPGMDPLKTTGQVSITKPNRFRWAVNQPHKELYVSDGKQVWHFDKALDQVTVMPLTQQLAMTPMLLLSGQVTQLSQLFTITQVQPGKFMLVPKHMDNSNMKQIVLEFKDQVLFSMQLQNVLGQVTTVSFLNVELNQHLPDSDFVFTPPAGVDVLHLGR